MQKASKFFILLALLSISCKSSKKSVNIDINETEEVYDSTVVDKGEFSKVEEKEETFTEETKSTLEVVEIKVDGKIQQVLVPTTTSVVRSNKRSFKEEKIDTTKTAELFKQLDDVDNSVVEEKEVEGTSLIEGIIGGVLSFFAANPLVIAPIIGAVIVFIILLIKGKKPKSEDADN